MNKKKKSSKQETHDEHEELDEHLEALHQEFSQALANKIYQAIEKMGESFAKKHDYDSTVSTFNVLLSVSANCAIELGIPLENFIEISKDFWKNANQLLNEDGKKEILQSSSWLEPSTTDPKKLS